MTQEELIKEIKQLPVEERIAVMDAISKSVRSETGGDYIALEGSIQRGGGDVSGKSLKARVSIVDQLYGIARPNGPTPSDGELKEDYVRYLTEKYS